MELGLLGQEVGLLCLCFLDVVYIKQPFRSGEQHMSFTLG